MKCDLARALDVLFPTYKRRGFIGLEAEAYETICRCLSVKPLSDFGFDGHAAQADALGAQPQCALTQDQIAAKWQEAMDKWEGCLTRIEQMRDALANVLGLCDLLSHRDDIPSEVREILTDGWRRREAQSVWEQSSAHTRPECGGARE